MTSRAFTAEELRAKFLAHIRVLVREYPNDSETVAFSILCLVDGVTNLPAFDLVASPHPEDKLFHQGEDENWVEDGLVINDGPDLLHELFLNP